MHSRGGGMTQLLAPNSITRNYFSHKNRHKFIRELLNANHCLGKVNMGPIKASRTAQSSYDTGDKCTWKNYDAFLKSRCIRNFPTSMQKIKEETWDVRF